MIVGVISYKRHPSTF